MQKVSTSQPCFRQHPSQELPGAAAMQRGIPCCMTAGWGTWIASWGWGAVLICITVACHVTGVVLIQRWVDTIPRDARKVAFLRTIPGTIALIVAVALCLASLFGIESLIWAVAYVALGAVPTSAAAVLYSVSSMTTRGVSELSLAPQWRLMGALESGGGVLAFGISTAYLFSVMQWLWETVRKTDL